MNALNSLIIEGNVVRDGELVEVLKGFKVLKFSVAVPRYIRNEDGTSAEEISFFDCETYGNDAKSFASKITKGRGIRLVGRLKQEIIKDNDGKEFSRVYVVCEHIELKPVFNKN